MKTTARATLPFELKAQDDDARTFEGLSAAWSLDSGGDVIHPGAFKRTLDHWRESGRLIPLLDQHSAMRNPTHSVTRHTLGKMVEAEERAEGLWSRFQVAKTRAGDDLQALLRDGMVTGLSIGYAAINPERGEGGVRHLRELKLGEVSVVTFGMNADALIDTDSVKSIDDVSEALKEGRLTVDQIRALLSESDPPEEGTPTKDGPAHYEHQAALSARIRMLNLRRPAFV